jgi:hypothetical protein
MTGAFIQASRIAALQGPRKKRQALQLKFNEKDSP